MSANCKCKGVNMDVSLESMVNATDAFIDDHLSATPLPTIFDKIQGAIMPKDEDDDSDAAKGSFFRAQWREKQLMKNAPWLAKPSIVPGLTRGQLLAGGAVVAAVGGGLYWWMR